MGGPSQCEITSDDTLNNNALDLLQYEFQVLCAKDDANRLCFPLIYNDILPSFFGDEGTNVTNESELRTTCVDFKSYGCCWDTFQNFFGCIGESDTGVDMTDFDAATSLFNGVCALTSNNLCSGIPPYTSVCSGGLDSTTTKSDATATTVSFLSYTFLLVVGRLLVL